ncbi:MAG: hypothetical protein CM1200mP30_05060 [Pseudomonadota bacterium]|nr:MAG: hypothetical protein CM1200mP30_05060 [Pseudomonadota bacterium]
MDRYDLNRSVAPFVGFIDLLTNWYIRRSRRRFWKAGHGDDKKEAYATLYTVLFEFSKVVAPFIPFIAEGIFRTLRHETDHKVYTWNCFRKRILNSRGIDLEKRMDLCTICCNNGTCTQSKTSVENSSASAKNFLGNT